MEGGRRLWKGNGRPGGSYIIVAIEKDAKKAWDDFCEADLREKSKVIGSVGAEVVLVAVPASKVTSALKASRLGKVLKGTKAFGRFKKGTLNSVVKSKFDDVLKGADNLVDLKKITPSLKTSRGKAYFWSGKTNGIGGAERALEIAKKNGGTTLEGLIESKKIKMPVWDANNPAVVKVWEEVSAAFAKQVSGEVRAVVGNSLRKGNVWENIELPQLKNNLNVTKIITIDPETLAEKVIFRR